MIAHLVFAVKNTDDLWDEILIGYTVDDKTRADVIAKKAEKSGLYRNIRVGSCDLDKLPKSK